MAAWRKGRAMLQRMLAVAAMALILLVGCGGGEEEGQIAPTASPQVSPTAMPTVAAAAVATPAETSTASEEYRAEMVRLLPDVTQIFSVEWPEALGTEPLGGEAWQEAVSALAARVDGLRVRIEMIEAPEDFAVSRALMIESLTKTAEALRKVRGVAYGDAQGLRDALADVQNAMAIWHEAMEQVPAP